MGISKTANGKFRVFVSVKGRGRKTATCDTKVLEEKIVECLEDENKRNDIITHAWNKLNETFSFNAVRKQIEGIRYE